jgi:hypothetical protein
MALSGSERPVSATARKRLAFLLAYRAYRFAVSLLPPLVERYNNPSYSMLDDGCREERCP